MPVRDKLKDLEENRPKAGKEFSTESGIPVKPVYTPLDLDGWDYHERLGAPGEYPFTRGITPTMYRDEPWLIGQYAGFATAETTNEWYKYLLGQGATSLSVAWDLPTQIGYDSDHPLAFGEVGKQGVACASLADMESMFDGIPIHKIRLSTTANAIGPIFLAWILAIYEKRGLQPQGMQLSIQNDSLKEFFSRGTQIFIPQASVKLSNDCVEYCVRNGLNEFHPLACSGYHIAEAGATAVQEMAFTMADAETYIEDLLGRGLDIDDFAHHIVGFLGTGIDFFEEICKLRAFRRMWARMMKEKYGAKKPGSMRLFYRSYTRGSYLTAQQPLNNIVRGALETLAAVLGGIQSNVTSSYDEALSLPSSEAVRIALRTQQIIADESGVTKTVDPLGGSYYVEWLTGELEKRATELLSQVEEMGGAIVAIEEGFFEKEIARSAYENLKQVQSGERVTIGVNKYVVDEPVKIEIRKVDHKEEDRQIEKLRKLRKERENDKVKVSLNQLRREAEEGVNLVPCLIDTVKTYATLGEICDTLREVYGEYKPVRL